MIQPASQASGPRSERASGPASQRAWQPGSLRFVDSNFAGNSLWNPYGHENPTPYNWYYAWVKQLGSLAAWQPGRVVSCSTASPSSRGPQYIYIYIYIYICMYVYIYIYDMYVYICITYIYIHVCMICMCVYIYIYDYNIYIYIYVNIYISLYISLSLSLSLSLYIYIYIYLYTYTHIHIDAVSAPSFRHAGCTGPPAGRARLVLDAPPGAETTILRKGTNGINPNGGTANLVFFDRGTFWVLPLTYFHIPRSDRAYLFLPICENPLHLQRPHQCWPHLSATKARPLSGWPLSRDDY